ncbi:glycoside hydrolase family 2 protein [Microbacterium invictum]|uniref:Glycoside hydrolase family 2 TIM barrel-domain containing protein n=1 Tax=Microbacterium invictum TaxID=515415 RepID=A0ABZ0VAH9_9MICO|nr:sugar-binding domain-containing protein [Microbacterium invictum]WQB69575.1 glycoside hydrolase family 2 TIM barrel-domain containing protein [Microbacterium invictum]
MAEDVFSRPSRQDGTYPRPQLVRPAWHSLDGTWGFEYDDGDEGLTGSWNEPGRPTVRTITVPYPPESALSGVGDTGHHPVVWYRRDIAEEDLAAAAWKPGRRLLLHFGAVDYRASVWADGRLIGIHEGGHTPFSFDVTAAAQLGPFEIVVRAEDDPDDLEQPRGKQDWLPDPHVIWYHRTTGIWQTVWLEAVPPLHVTHLAWETNLVAGTVSADIELSARPPAGTEIDIDLSYEGTALARISATATEPRSRVVVPLSPLTNGQGYETLLWTVENPRLVDARLTARSAAGIEDAVASYFGMRTVAVDGARFLVNDRPAPIVAVLEQGYWPQSHLAAPSAEALREEVQLIKDLGFSTARVHQKIEDPRFLYWADRLGLMVWEELPSAYRFSTTSVSRLTREWTEAIARDRSHPCVVAWVPVNESWGVQQVAHDPRQRDFVRALFHLTRALDSTRPVIANDGWEHTDSSLLTVHDYENDPELLSASYRDEVAVAATLAGIGPAGRRMTLLPQDEAPLLRSAPVVISEFGGVTYAPDAEIETWGYAVAESSEDFERRLRGVFGALQASKVLGGYCYTQLTDTLQEANGLVDENRSPKLPVEVIRSIVRGES